MAHIALDKWDLPIVRDVLETELLVEVVVPHIPVVDRFQSIKVFRVLTRQ